MDGCLLKGKRFVCREWAFSKLLHCVETRPQAKTCGTLILGGPGSGKTALCCELKWPTSGSSRHTSQSAVHTSRHELRKQDLHSRLLAAHFCEAHSVDSLAVFSFVRNIRHQLLQDAHVRAECARNLSLAQKCACQVAEALQRGDADDAFLHGVVSFLSQIAAPERNRFLLVDSLDESFLCDDTLANISQPASAPSVGITPGEPSPKRQPIRSRTIAELLSRYHAAMPSWLSLVCTVRKQSRSVTRLFTGFRTITLDDTKKTHVVRDVQQYILQRVEADDALRALLNNRDSVEMLNALHIKSNACFLYLETVLNGMQDSFIALREVKDIPGTLNGLYLWLCQRLFSKRSLFQQVQPILNAIVASRAPLSESQLFAALWSRDHRLDYTHFNARLDLLGRLLVYGPPVHPAAPSVPPPTATATATATPVRMRTAAFDSAPTDNTLLLFHHSFAEWLLDVKLCTRKYLCNVQDGHAMLAMALTLENAHAHTNGDVSPYRVAEYVLHVCKCVLDPSTTQRGTLSAASSSLLLQHAGLNLAQLGLAANQNSRKPTGNTDTATETSNSMSVSVVETPASDTHSNFAGGQLTRAHIALWFLFSGVDLTLLGQLQRHFAVHGDSDCDQSSTSKRIVDSLMERFMSSLSCAADRDACTYGENAALPDSKLTSRANGAADGDARQTTQDIDAIARQIQAMTASVNRSFANSFECKPVDTCDAGANPTSGADCAQPRVDSQTLPVVALSRKSSTHARLPKASVGSSDNISAPVASSETQAAASRLLLCAAAAQGNLQIVRAVVEAAEGDLSALINVRDRNGSTPLGLAARHAHVDVLEYLICNKADLDVFDNDGWSALRAAAWAGNTAIVDTLLRAGASPNATGVDKRTAIRAAAWNGHEDVLKLLLNAGADINLSDVEGRTPLIAAAYMGHVDIIELLVDAGADINHTDNDGRSALSIACMCVSNTSYHPQIISVLLEHGAEANRVDRDGMTPLLIAVYEGNREVCEILLEWDVDIEFVDRQGRTPLLAAVVMGHAAIVNTLLFWGAQVDTIDAEGRSILSIAAAYGNADVVAELLARGLDEQHRDNAGLTPLHLAAFEGHADVCRLLLENSAHTNQLDNDGRTALLLATQESQLDCVRTLIDFGADIDLAAHDGRTPLRCVALENNYQLVESLVREFGADVDARDADGRSTLYVLVLENRIEMARLLLDLRADPALPDADGRTCLHVAAWQGSLELLEALLALGAPPDAVDAERRTPLQIASWQGHDRLISALVRAGANVDHACVQGATALSVAAQEGHVECVRVLLQAGANTHHQDQFGRTPLRVAMKNQHLDVVRLLESATGSLPPATAAQSSAQAQAIAPPAPPSRSNLRASPLPKSIAQSQLTLFCNADPYADADAHPDALVNRHSTADFRPQLTLNSAVQNQLQNALHSSSNSSNSNSNLALAAKQQPQATSVTSSNNSLQAATAAANNSRLSVAVANSASNSQLATNVPVPVTVNQTAEAPPSVHKRRSKRSNARNSRSSKVQPSAIGNDADAYFERDAFAEELDYGAALIIDGLAQFGAPLDSRAPTHTHTQTPAPAHAQMIVEEQLVDGELSDESDDNHEVTATDSNFLWNGDSSRLAKAARAKQQRLVVDSTSWQRGRHRDLADAQNAAKKDAGQTQAKRSSGLFGFFRRKEKKRADESLNATAVSDKPVTPVTPAQPPAKSIATRKQRSTELAEQTQREQLITQELIQQQRHAILQQQAGRSALPTATTNGNGNGNCNGTPAISSSTGAQAQLAPPVLQPFASPSNSAGAGAAAHMHRQSSVRVSASSGSQQSGTPGSSRPTSMIVLQPGQPVSSEMFAMMMGQSAVANVGLASANSALSVNVASAKRETHL